MEKSIRLLLNMELVYERLCDLKIPVLLSEQNMNNCLSGLSLYDHNEEAVTEYLYITSVEYLHRHPCNKRGIHFVVTGEGDISGLFKGQFYIRVQGDYDSIQLFNKLLQIFSYYRSLESRLTDIVLGNGDLDDICELMAQYFSSGVLIHDEFYRVLAQPKSYRNMPSYYDFDMESGLPTLNRSLIESLNLSESYKETMGTHGAYFWDSDFSDSHAIYTNLWENDKCFGRLLVYDENKDIRPGELSILSYFGAFLEVIYCYNPNAIKATSINPSILMAQALSDKNLTQAEIEKAFLSLGWELSDRFVCGCISFQFDDVTRMAVHSISINIKKKIPACSTLFHDHIIYVLINLTKSRMQYNDIQMVLSENIREGMLRMAISYPFWELTRLSDYLRQAQIALDYNFREVVPRWFCTFGDYALMYWLSHGIGEFEPESILPLCLQRLVEYDKDNNTELYRTLFVYLNNERNQTLASQILKINRSTLLKRIEKIQGFVEPLVNLDDSEYRMKLLMGMYYMNSL